MTRQTVEPSAFSHFLATNYQRDPDYVVLAPGGEVFAAKWHRPGARTVTGAALAGISHTGRCIGVLILRKSCCNNGLSQDQGSPDADRV